MTVKAAQWRGDNLEEMRELLKDIVDTDFDGVPAVYSDYIEPYTLITGSGGGYYVLFFLGEEVDPENWVIVYEDDEVETMHDKQFNRLFVKR